MTNDLFKKKNALGFLFGKHLTLDLKQVEKKNLIWKRGFGKQVGHFNQHTNP